MARRARVRGRLYDLPYGYPALVVEPEDVLLAGTGDAAADLESAAGVTPPRDGGGPPWVHGDLVDLPDGEARLPRLDSLEGFGGPDGDDLYLRVLVTAWPEDGVPVAAWTYVWPGTPDLGRHLPGGRWPVPGEEP